MKKIKELLTEKGSQIWSVEPEASVYEALARMAEKNVGALLVVHADRPVGILSERDYTRRVVLQGKASKDTQVREIMTPRPICISPECRVEEAMALMTERRIRHLPVIEGDQVLGLISIGDLVKAIIAQQQFLIEQLERYISG